MVCAKQLGWALAILSTCGLSHAERNITSDTYFYGQSEPVYPSPSGKGTGNWREAYSKAAAMVSQMTLKEKNNLTYGFLTTSNGCSGNIQPIPRLGFTGMCLQDAGNGVRYTDFVNSYPSGIHIGASWNKSLAYERGLYMGGEFRKKGVQVALGPVVGPLGRTTTGGRNWEGPSNDPYLGGAIAAATVEGIQGQGVITSVKHYIGNEQELYRVPTINSENQPVEAVSSNIDDKTMHELYLWPFQDALKAGAGNIMCSYNRVNNTYACQNSKNLNGLLKTELGFEGFVVSDWGAQHSGVAAANAGLDMAMPDGGSYWGNKFTKAYTNGSVSMTRLDDMATRIIAAWYQMRQDDSSYPSPGVGMPYNLSGPHPIVNALTRDAKPAIYDGAVEGHVLVKNTKNALPLRSPKLISVFGYDAKTPDSYMPNGNFIFSNPFMIGYEPAVFQLEDAFSSTILNEPYDYPVAFNGTLNVGGGSGANTGPYLSAPLDALQQRAYEDGSVVMWDTTGTPGSMGSMEISDACLVFINAFATEGLDPASAYDHYLDALVNKVAKTCPNTIVVIHNAGTRLVDQFVNNDNVTAVVFAHLPGQILRPRSAGSFPIPSPRANQTTTPSTTPAASHPTGSSRNPTSTRACSPTTATSTHTTSLPPRYEFGLGLSYTSFSFSGLHVSPVKNGTPAYPSGAIEQGGAVDLWDTAATVTASVRNTGRRSGAEVAQTYVGIPNGPVKQLRGFEKAQIPAGGSVKVSFPLTRRDLSSWDVVAQKWQLQSGSYKIYVGSSSRDLPLTATMHVKADASS